MSSSDTVTIDVAGMLGAIIGAIRDSHWNKVGEVDGNDIRNSQYKKVGEIDGTAIRNASWKKVGEIDGSIIRDSNWRKIGEVEGGFHTAVGGAALLLLL